MTPNPPRRLLTALVLVGALLVVPGVAQAAFSGRAVAATSVATATMVTPTGVQAVPTCSLGFTSSLTMSWNATPDRLTRAYVITVSRDNGASQTFTVPAGTTRQNFTIPNGTAYTFRVHSTLLNWSSTPSAGIRTGCGLLGL